MPASWSAPDFLALIRVVRIVAPIDDEPLLTVTYFGGAGRSRSLGPVILAGSTNGKGRYR